MPRQWELQPDGYQLCVMSLKGFSGNDYPESRAGGLPADLSNLSHDNKLERYL
jgi:hypothetical protein